jgi:hypothetical protein
VQVLSLKMVCGGVDVKVGQGWVGCRVWWMCDMDAGEECECGVGAGYVRGGYGIGCGFGIWYVRRGRVWGRYKVGRVCRSRSRKYIYQQSKTAQKL